MSSVLNFMSHGGFFMWAIAGVWAAGLVISLERFVTFSNLKSDGLEMMNKIRTFLKTNQHQDAVKTCSESHTLLGSVMKSFLERSQNSSEGLHNSLQESIKEAVPTLHTRMTHLGKTINASAALVCLGTVHGVSLTIMGITSQKAYLYTEGTSVALHTTAFGLVAGVSLLVIHNVLIRRGNQIITQIEGNGLMLADVLSAKKATVRYSDKKAA